MLSFDCAGCGKHFTVRDELAGRQARCRQCGTVNNVPAIAAPTPEICEWEAVSIPPQQPQVFELAPLPFEEPTPAGPMFAGPAVGGPSHGALLQRRYKPRQNNSAAFWCLLSVGGFAAAALLILLLLGVTVATRKMGGGKKNDFVASNTGGKKPGFWSRHFGSVNKNPTAYLPANYTLGIRLRVLDIMAHVQSVPAAKAYVDQQTREPARPGVRLEQPDDMYLLTDGAATYMAATTRGAVDAKVTLPHSRTDGTHAGITIYHDQHFDAGAAKPFTPLRYYAFPHDRLMVAASGRMALEGMLDQAAAKAEPAISLPMADVAVHVRDVNLLELPRSDGPIRPGDIASVMAQATFGSTMSFSVSLQTRDAGVADLLRTKAVGAIDEAKNACKDNPGSPQWTLLQAVSVSSAGEQFSVTGAVPMASLIDLGIFGPPGSPGPSMASASPMPFAPPINFQFRQPFGRAFPSPGSNTFSQMPGLMPQPAAPPSPNFPAPTSPRRGRQHQFGMPNHSARPPLQPHRPPRMTPHLPRRHMGRP